MVLFSLGVQYCWSSISKFYQWPQVYYCRHRIFHEMGWSHSLNLHHRQENFQIYPKLYYCRFGIPQDIITDNGTPFKNQEVATLCRKFGITHNFSTRYYPQGNGQAEATNKTLLKILKKTVDAVGRNWHLQIALALWAYRTSICTPTGATPFSLVYGSEAILPIEIELPSLRVSLKNLISEEEYRVAHLQELALLDERCLNALNHLHMYQNHLQLQYHKKVKPREFEVGDLVLQHNMRNL